MPAQKVCRSTGVRPTHPIDHGYAVLAVVASQRSRELPRPASVSNGCLYPSPCLYFCLYFHLYFCPCHRLY